jgi:LacI family transcriptional regulator, galactose operon repressor
MADTRDMVGKTTMKEIAQQAGVALSSVSRVLNGHPAVSEGLRQRVMRVVDELKYEPNHTAMSLRRGATKTVAFLVRDIASPLFADIIKAAEEHLRGSGYSMLLTNSGDETDREAGHIRMLTRRQVDGLILCLTSETDHDTTAALRAVRAPLVLFDRHVAGLTASTVLSDHYRGFRDATEHLIELGHRRIALINGPLEVLASRERLRGYKAALRSARIRSDPALIRLGRYSHTFGHQQSTQLLQLPEPPTAIIAGGSQLSYGVLLALRQCDLELGRDIAFVACDSAPWGELLRPSLTVVERDAAEIGTVTAELLLSMIESGAGPQVRKLPTRLRIGESTMPPSRFVNGIRGSATRLPQPAAAWSTDGACADPETAGDRSGS